MKYQSQFFLHLLANQTHTHKKKKKKKKFKLIFGLDLTNSAINNDSRMFAHTNTQPIKFNTKTN